MLRVRAGLLALVHLATGLGTAPVAGLLVVALVVSMVLCAVGVGFWLLPRVLRGVRSLADLERTRLSWVGHELVGPPDLPRGLRAALADPALRREVVWLVPHATLGIILPIVALQLAGYAVQYSTAPAWLQAWPGRRLLSPPPGTDLSLRVAELTATRAAALDAHAVELRRIERSLHDGSQNRLVTVTVLIGAARRGLARDPAFADELLERAQSAAELALVELREVVRSVLPPVLTDRGLTGALTGLAADSAVPCHVEVDVAGRCAVSVEATVYFVVAEALTNTARHSGAARVKVSVRRRGDRLSVRVRDDGGGGAREDAGSGLAGIRRRVQALDGTMTLTSPPGGPTTVDVELTCGS